ncbi:MAG: NAD(P)H-hydrate dehydratase [Actinomycetota bacterium]
MLDVLRAADVRNQDAACVARGIPVAGLMRNAGFAVARAARAMLGGTSGLRIVVVCGKGNNGGDGIVAGRFLTGWGAHVVVVPVAGPLAALPAAQLEGFRGRVCDSALLDRELARADLVIDAVLGVGLARAPEGPSAAAIEAIARATAPVLSIDVPSGIDADTGSVPGVAVRADVTVTLGGLKPGLLFVPGAVHAGRIQVAGIGVPVDLAGGSARALERSDVARALPRRAPGEHKRSAGTLLVVAGSTAMPGAAALVVSAGMHTGAGLTVLCAPEAACRAAVTRTPEVTTIPLSSDTFDASAVEAICARASEFHAVAVGPGLTTQPQAVAAVRELLARLDIPVVLDADGLGVFAGDLAGPARARSAPVVLTPHAGELARLSGQSASKLDSDRLAAASDAAAESGCLIVFKGPGTVIAAPDGETWVNPTGGPSLAQGGTGDVLTGMLGALAAQAAARGEPVNARLIALGVWLHGAAGDRLAARLDPHTSNASALAAEIGPLLHEVAG